MNDWMDAQTRVERAHIFSRQQQWKSAADELQAAVAVNPNNHLWYFNLGLARDMTGDFKAACDAYQSALELKPTDLQTLNCLGVCYTKLGKYAQALGCFARLEKIAPDFEPGYCNRIELYTEIGQHEQAEVMFYLARQVKDHCPICYFNIAISHYLRENYEQAIACFKQVREIEPDYPQANSRIADCYYAQEKYELAHDFYLRELTSAGADADILIDLGDVCAKLGDYDQAQIYFGRAGTFAPENPAIFYNLAMLALRTGNRSAARSALRKTVEIAPAFPTAKEKLEALSDNSAEVSLTPKKENPNEQACKKSADSIWQKLKKLFS